MRHFNFEALLETAKKEAQSLTSKILFVSDLTHFGILILKSGTLHSISFMDAFSSIKMLSDPAKQQVSLAVLGYEGDTQKYRDFLKRMMESNVSETI